MIKTNNILASICRIISMIEEGNINDVFVDLFAGAGGVTEAIEQTNRALVVACVNHDHTAITSHAKNHPHALHFEEDIRTLDVSPIVTLIERIRAQYPGIRVHLWASLECTNFSKAKGGLPREADSRTLGYDLERYIIALDPDKVWIENVTEFMSWGPLDANGKPISKCNGRDFIRWQKLICDHGYRYDHAILNSADFGAYQTRTRYFAQFAKPYMDITWPAPTHSKKPTNSGLFGALKRWKPVREVLDLSDHGNSIFTRKKPLSTRTMERIYHGLVKFVPQGREAFISKYNSNKPNKAHSGNDIEQPSPVVSTQNRLAIVAPIIAKYYGNGHNCLSIEGPTGTLRTKAGEALILPFMMQNNSDNPASKVFLLDRPARTLTATPNQYVVSPFLYRDFTNGGSHRNLDIPCGTVLASPKLSLISPVHWIMNTNFNNVGSSIETSSSTITASRHHMYLMNPQYMQPGRSLDASCFTLIARMDKMPPYLIVTETGKFCLPIYKTDCQWTKKIKDFMAEHGIIDIKMRMLKVEELLKIQGFPEDYYLHGNQSDKKKQIGNAVEVNCVCAMIRANIERDELRKAN